MLPVRLGAGSLMLDWLLLEGRGQSKQHEAQADTAANDCQKYYMCSYSASALFFTAWSVPVDIFIWFDHIF